MNQRKVIIITGGVGSGKTTFLNNLSTLLRRSWSVDGFISLPRSRPLGKKQSASSYDLKFIRESNLLPWARKKTVGDGYHFDDETLRVVLGKFSVDAMSKLDIVLFDDLGFLEVHGEGFSPLVVSALRSNEKAMIVSVKKEAVESFVDKFNISQFKLVDLDQLSGRKCKKQVLQELAKMDGEDIGIFSTINGMIEVSFGSFLHATRFPFKGYILVGLQNFFLVLFSKELKGRGLGWISLISAGMKSFSPAGGRLKPMIYIFLQGLCFSLPISLLGHNFISCLIGSLLIQIISLVFKFLSAYIAFGESVFDASLNVVNQILSFFSFPSVSLATLFMILIAGKLVLGASISLIAYSFDFSPFLFRWKNKVNCLEESSSEEMLLPTWKQSILGAFHDMRLKRFFLPFILTLSLIYFFSNLALENFAGVAIRALIISWMAFVLSRRMDFNKIMEMLRKYGLEHIATAMEKSIRTVQSFRKR